MLFINERHIQCWEELIARVENEWNIINDIRILHLLRVKVYKV